MCARPTEPCPNQTSAAGAAANYSQDGPDLNSTSDQIAKYVCWSFLKTHTFVFRHWDIVITVNIAENDGAQHAAVQAAGDCGGPGQYGRLGQYGFV